MGKKHWRTSEEPEMWIYFAWMTIMMMWTFKFGPIDDPGSYGFKSWEINIQQMLRYAVVQYIFSNRRVVQAHVYSTIYFYLYF